MKDFKNKKVLLLPATLHPKKNQELAICAVDLLKADFPNLLLVLVGDGKDKVRLQKLVNDKNLTKFVKFAGVAKGNEISVYYKNCNLVLVTSNVDNEGLSMTALEALYCGKMPLVSKFAGVAEILEKEKIGIVYDPLPHILAQKIKSYLQNPYKFEKMLLKGQNWVKREQSLKNYAEKTFKFYLNILRRD